MVYVNCNTTQNISLKLQGTKYESCKLNLNKQFETNLIDCSHFCCSYRSCYFIWI